MTANEILIEVWIQYALEMPGGEWWPGGIEVLENVEDYLRAKGLIDERGHPYVGRTPRSNG